MRQQAIRIVMGFVILSGVISDAFAADLTRKLKAGATLGEVLGAWGDPLEKVEKEVKQEVVWHYPDGAKVVFKQGKVTSWLAPASVREREAEVAAAKAAATPSEIELSGETRDLVRDIAREVPSGPDAPFSDAPSAGAGAVAAAPPARSQPVTIPNQIPPGGKGAPPGIAPSLDAMDEEEEE